MYCSGVASTCRQPAKTASYFPINKYGTEWSELVGSQESNTFTLDSTHIHLISARSNFTTPQFYNSFTRGHFTTSHLPGSEVSAPKFSLCLPVPFTRLPFHLVCEHFVDCHQFPVFQRESCKSRCLCPARLLPPLLPLPLSSKPGHT